MGRITQKVIAADVNNRVLGAHFGHNLAHILHASQELERERVLHGSV